MKERPILFSAPMVRAILNGGKTQTRRVVKGRAIEWLKDGYFLPSFVADADNYLCPYGYRRDRRWVRETFCHAWDDERDCWTDPERYLYRADGVEVVNIDGGERSPWKPSIHMPRRASRITLEVTGVRVERLQAITESDAQAEGSAPSWLDADDNDTVHAQRMPTYRQGFARIWHDINGADSWDANPWVWVVEFKRVEQAHG